MRPVPLVRRRRAFSLQLSARHRRHNRARRGLGQQKWEANERARGRLGGEGRRQHSAQGGVQRRRCAVVLSDIVASWREDIRMRSRRLVGGGTTCGRSARTECGCAGGDDRRRKFPSSAGAQSTYSSTVCNENQCVSSRPSSLRDVVCRMSEAVLSNCERASPARRKSGTSNGERCRSAARRTRCRSLMKRTQASMKAWTAAVAPDRCL